MSLHAVIVVLYLMASAIQIHLFVSHRIRGSTCTARYEVPLKGMMAVFCYPRPWICVRGRERSVLNN